MTKKFLPFLLLIIFLTGCRDFGVPSREVDTFIGTGLHGHTYPGATVPHGMVQLSPDTRTGGWDACGGYHYSDSTILGFSLTHLSGTGCADLSDFLFTPICGDIPEGATPALPFSHESESAAPGWYKVILPGVTAELTASPRTGVQRYTFTGKGLRHIIIDLGHSVTDITLHEATAAQTAPDRIEGMRRLSAWVRNRSIWMSANFSEPMSEFRRLDERRVVATFPETTSSLTIVTGISGTDASHARMNVTEACNIPFDQLKAEADDSWNEALSSIRIKGGSKSDRTNFYTALYHTMVCPNAIEDMDGSYRNAGDGISNSGDGRFYSTLSLWDTFRAWNPLQTLLDTTMVRDMVRSMLDVYDHTGELPKWPLASGETDCMIGYHSVSVIWDAYRSGIRGFDSGKALEAMVASSDRNRKGSDLIRRYGYIPANLTSESVSRTLEFCYDDWCIARMAEALGQTQLAAEYDARASRYTSLFDGHTGFFRGRKTDGGWVVPFDRFATSRDLTEATPWHYRFFVPHDIRNLEALMGGREAFRAALDSLMTCRTEARIEVSDVSGLIGQYAHGNEPGHHSAYLFTYAGQPWKTQYYTRLIMDTMYSPAPEGIVGNEDCGQMSAWYVMTALGIYPVCPGSGQFILSAPRFPKATLRLANGKQLEIIAKGAGKTYIQSVTLNGKDILRRYLTHEELMEGGQLIFRLGNKPDTREPQDEPYSFTTSPAPAMPYISEDVSLFPDSVTIHLGSRTPGASVRYTLDGSEPGPDSPLYTAPLVLRKSATLSARAFMGNSASPVFRVRATRADFAPASKATGLSRGVSFAYHEGDFQNVAQMASSPVLARGNMTVPDIGGAPAEDYFGYEFSGYIDVPARGIWDFVVTSDDGAVLCIDGLKVVDNDGTHSAVPANGRVALEAGLHPFKLQYLESYEGQELSWGWKAPDGKEFLTIPAENLYYKK